MFIRRVAKSLERLAPGMLFFLGYYEIVAGLRVPFNFSVNRATYTYLFQAPLFGFFEFDLAVSLLSAILLLYRRRLSLKGVWLIIPIFLSLIMAFSFMFNIIFLAHVALGSICLLVAILCVGMKRLSSLLPGFLASLLPLETISLVSLTLYYALGGWNKTLLQIILRERLFWSPLEWISVLILIASMWNALIHVLVGKHIFKPPALVYSQEKNGNSGNMVMLILALLLNLLLVVLPHLPTVNPDFKPVSVDVMFYKSFLEEAEDDGLMPALANGGMGRPLYLIAIYWLWTYTGKNTVLLMDLLHPLAALTGLTLISFYVARRVSGGKAAGWAALLIPLGYAATGFLSGGFQANSVALIPALLALIIDPENLRGWFTLTTLLTMTGLIHPWTHLMYSAAMAVRNLKNRRKLILSIAAFILSYCIVYTVDSALTAGGYRAESPLMPLALYIGFHILRNWFDAIRLWIWNALSNPIYLSTAILSFEPLSASVMGAAAPLTLILNAEMTCRIILNLPLQIQASNFLGRIRNEKMKVLIVLALLTRVLGNLTGLTPLTTNI